MPVQLPDLSQVKGLVRVVACGEVLAADHDLQTFLNTDLDARTVYSAGGTRHYVRLLAGPTSSRETPANHFHVEIALQGYFSGKKAPAASHKISEVRSLLNKILGAKLDVWGSYNFRMPFEELPDGGIIRLLSIETKVGKVGIGLQGGDLSVTGSPVLRITWSRVADKAVCKLSMVAHFVGMVAGDSYLADVQSKLHSLFEFHVLGKEPPAYV